MHPSVILTIGTELTRGELVNSNAAWLGERLTALGFDVVSHLTIADDRARIVRTLRSLAREAKVVVVTGGLGPTTDDLTSECAAEALGVPMQRSEASLAAIVARFERLGRPMSPSNAKQADFPEGADVLPNAQGTAPGFGMVLDGCQFFFMPGVPREMKAMFEGEVVPRIAPLGRALSHQIHLHCFGLPESQVGERLAGLEAATPGLTLGYRAHFPEIEVKVLVRADDLATAKTRAAEVAREVRARLGEAVFGEGDDTFAAVVARSLLEKKLTLAVAESCTGGLVGHLLTREAGASAYLLADAVTYANEAKTRFAGVDPGLIAAHGAVSEEVARAMAEGIRERAGADVALSLTGVAGPSGGSPEKPVGTVFLAVATAKGTRVKKVFFAHERPMVQMFAAFAGLDLVRREVEAAAL